METSRWKRKAEEGGVSRGRLVQGLGGRAWPQTPGPLRGAAAGSGSLAGPASLLLATATTATAATATAANTTTTTTTPSAATTSPSPLRGRRLPACPPAARAGSWSAGGGGRERRERGREAGRRAGRRKGGRQAEKEEGGESGGRGRPYWSGLGGPRGEC